MENESQGIMLFVIIAIMTTTIIGVIVGFAIVIKNVNSKIQTNQEMISAAVVQDEINLKQLGLKLSADLNKELGDASTRTIKSLQQISTQVDSVNDKATSSAAKIQSNVDSLAAGKTAFQSLAVGPAQLTRDANGNLDFNTGPIFTVTSSNLILALKNSPSASNSSSSSNPNPPPYKISQDANNNINLGGPGQLIAPPRASATSAAHGASTRPPPARCACTPPPPTRPLTSASASRNRRPTRTPTRSRSKARPPPTPPATASQSSGTSWYRAMCKTRPCKSKSPP